MSATAFGDPDTMTPLEVAHHLRTSRQTVYRLIWGGKLGWNNTGTEKRPRIRVTREAFARYLKSTERAA